MRNLNIRRLPYKECEIVYKALGLRFTDGQLPAVTSNDRFPVLGGGERGGKSYATAAMFLPHPIFLPRVKRSKFYTKDGVLKKDPAKQRIRDPHFVIFGPHYKEPRVEFELIENWLRELNLLVETGINKPSKGDDGAWRMVTTDGVCIMTWSLDDPRTVRSVDLEGALVVEAGICPYDAVLRINGRVSGTQGFILYNGTMEDAQQWYHDWMLQGERSNLVGIKSYRLPTWTNNFLFGQDEKGNKIDGRQHPEIIRLREMYPDDIYAMRVEAEPRPPRLRVLKEFTPEIVGDIEIPEDANIEIWVDPGYATAYAILWVAYWKRGEEGDEYTFFYVFDEFYEQGKITDDIIGMCKQHPMYKHVKRGVIDIGAKGHRDAGESAYEKWCRMAPTVSLYMKLQKEQDLIERIRTSAKAGQLLISPKCKGLLAEAGLGEPVFPEMHPWKYDADKDGRIISERPKDKWNHSAKALGYGLLNIIGNVEYRRKKTKMSRFKRSNVTA